MIDGFEYNNEDESEMGQIHSIHLSLNAIAAIHRNMTAGVSRCDCIECGEKIPLARQNAVPGCIRCIYCQTVFEHQK